MLVKILHITSGSKLKFLWLSRIAPGPCGLTCLCSSVFLRGGQNWSCIQCAFSPYPCYLTWRISFAFHQPSPSPSISLRFVLSRLLFLLHRDMTFTVENVQAPVSHSRSRVLQDLILAILTILPAEQNSTKNFPQKFTPFSQITLCLCNAKLHRQKKGRGMPFV